MAAPLKFASPLLDAETIAAVGDVLRSGRPSQNVDSAASNRSTQTPLVM